MLASALLIQGKSRMRKRACTDLCGGRPAMVVPTATAIAAGHLNVGSQMGALQGFRHLDGLL